MSVDTSNIQVILSEKAAAEIQKHIAADPTLPVETTGLRIAVLPGGCSGFKYDLNIAEKSEDDDIILESSGVRLYVDGFSLQYLNGVTIDYVSSMQGSGFSFTNPNATGGCGCGTSFTA
jgi:iron-sulfur cluster assembly accessory protein